MGAPLDGVSWPGSVHVFARSGSSWTQQSTLHPDDPGPGYHFGISVSVAGDVAMFGALGASGPNGNAGAVYDFGRALDIGVACSADDECASGYCRDEVCCDSACDSPCRGCSVSGSEGTCGQLPKGAAGQPSCAPYLCDGQDEACPSSCITNDDCADEAVCDESSECAPPLAAGSSCTRADQCASGQCINGVCGLDEGDLCTSADECVSGYCLDGLCCAQASCLPYICGEAGQCRQTCESTAHCASGHTCSSAGQCLPAAVDESDDGCGCRQVGRGGPIRWAWLVAGLATAALGVRRQRRSW